ncbi:MAP kinase phosphatase 2 [Mycena indigotica]|uniref:protein-tyrosine-phosphatase n=1 Tax=Mycena indigotica TaxID=2126181 RepID=A0A8H6W1A3_9AGAR|nr:MAP kinase phosphatase 2 [Mycena indigotica]KAF7301859.1 MAP kinase phosphatase 2 [Mycena indigotica]
MVWRNVDPIIENKLYLGNLVAARSTRSLTERRITHVLSVCKEPIPAELPQSGIQHMRIGIEDVDYADLLIHLPSACQFIHTAMQSGGAILVHDVQGVSRSAAVVAAYLMWSQRLSATKALETIRRSRDQIWPNAGFQEQLVLFELCQYAPSPMNGIYRSWRTKLEQQLRAAGML